MTRVPPAVRQFPAPLGHRWRPGSRPSLGGVSTHPNEDDGAWPEHFTCPECGLAYDSVSQGDAVVAVRSFPRRYREALAGPADDPAWDRIVRRRPSPGTFSALEYTGHVAMAMESWTARLAKVLVQDDFVFTPADVDGAVRDQHFETQPVEAVLQRLDAAATAFADAIAHLSHAQLERTFLRASSPRTVRWIFQQIVHEGSHHLRDVQRVLREATAAEGG